MLIHAGQPRFNPRTGKPEGLDRVVVHERCDLTGKVFVECGDPMDSPYCRVKLDYGSNDSMYGTADDLSFADQICMHPFLSEPYGIGENDAVKATKFAAERGLDYPMALRRMRCETAERLVAEGVIKPCQLTGYEGDEELPPISQYDEEDEDE